ncbi:MAG TPA: sodium-dependent transporter [Bacteroidetes bacterium]|nr:sodium-dependent transporter [Bacteroidota bacterium]
MAHSQEQFTSRWTLVLAVLGMAIGTGNIWRFPRIAAENGGGAFLIPWILFLFLWSIPLIITEFAIGKKTRLGPVGAIGHLIGKKWTWMGGFVAFCTVAIMFYYSVVVGWCLKYTWAALMGDLGQGASTTFWDEFINSPGQTLFFHLLSVTAGALIISRGVTKGIERATRLLIPGLGILLVIGAIRALTLEHAMQGLNFLFEPDWAKLMDYRVWIAALSQSAWSTGAGWGLVLTYAVYARKNEDIVLNSVIAGLGNNSASLLAGIVIFPAVFALAPQLNLGISPAELLSTSGPASTGLTFIWIPRLFSEIPASGFFLFIFFLALSIAAISSLIAMFELAARSLMNLGMTREKAVLFVWLICFIFGAPSALSMDFFQNQDWVWGVGLIVSGFFIAFSANRYGLRRFRQELINTAGNDLKAGVWYEYVMRFVIPFLFVVLLGWWFYQAITVYHRDTWWDPLALYSVATCLVQWGSVILLFVIFNDKIYHRTAQAQEELS